MAPRSRPARLVAAVVLSAGIALGAAGTAHADITVDSSSDAAWNQASSSWAAESSATWHQDDRVALFD
jgi:hypothetical protein